MIRPVIWFPAAAASLSLCLFSGISTATPAGSDASPPEAVEARIYENLPKEDAFDRANANLTEEYREPAFGFVRIPAKYSANALPLDRSEPFLLRATFAAALPPGEYEFRMRSKGSARFFINEELVLESEPQKPNKESHDELPPSIVRDGTLLRPAPYPHQEIRRRVRLDGMEHSFELLAVIGGRGLVPSPGELSVSVGVPDELPRLLGNAEAPLLTDAEWERYASERLAEHEAADRQRRLNQSAAVVEEWNNYHETVRSWAASLPPIAVPELAAPEPGMNLVDHFILERLEEAGRAPNPIISDLEYLRRLSLDVIGMIPTADEVRRFLAEAPEVRRGNALDRLLNHPGWADHWVSYWQDVLAENPGMLKPDLNNSGPFRWWVRQSFLDGLPFDRMVAELIQMEGSAFQGGPAAFKIATLNDAPLAAKADILSQAFLGEKLSCARCHDAPHHPHKQRDTFSLAAMLEGKPVKLPASSTVPLVDGFRKARVEVSLEPGREIEPRWPFAKLSDPETEFARLIPLSSTAPRTRREVAALMVSPENERFAQVTVNRVWKRYLGAGLVEPADDWDYVRASHPELLEFLAREFVSSGYDLKALARLILSSLVYQRSPVTVALAQIRPEERFFEGPERRRMSAEQLVDSLFRSADQEFACEELNLNPLGNRPLSQFLNLGQPRRAWEFTALMNERDRPSLALPTAQSIVDVLTTHGWRQSRQNPLTDREDAPSAMQTLLLANGIMGTRLARLSDDSGFTELALEERPLDDLIAETFLRILSRPPSETDLETAREYLAPVYPDRIREGAVKKTARPGRDQRVSWANHFDSEASSIRMEEERLLRMGAEPTERLTESFRESYEDLVWSLLNASEFILIP